MLTLKDNHGLVEDQVAMEVMEVHMTVEMTTMAAVIMTIITHHKDAMVALDLEGQVALALEHHHHHHHQVALDLEDHVALGEVAQDHHHLALDHHHHHQVVMTVMAMRAVTRTGLPGVSTGPLLQM